MPNRQKTFFILFPVLLLCVLLLSSPSPAALSYGEEDSGDKEVRTTQLVVIVSENIFNCYQGEELSKLAQDESTPPTYSYDSFDQVPRDTTINIIYLAGDSVLDALPSSTISELSALVSEGNFVGINGNGSHMRQVLDITDSADEATSSDSVPTVFFTYGVPDGAREDLLISLETAPSTGNLLVTIIDWIYWIFEKHQITIQNEGAWSATYSKDWRGSMGSGGGTYRFLVNVFKLNSNSASYDWYRVDASYQSAITGYSKTGGHCGWYTSAMNLTAKVDTTNGSTLYEYMPTGTVSDRTEGFSIGGGLETGGAGVNASYSLSYNTPDVTIQDNSNYVTNTAKWVITMVGPSYTWYPFYSEPANVARNSYQVQPSFIVQVPKNKAMTVRLNPEIKQQYDDLTFYFFVLSVKTKWWSWTSGTLNVRVGP
jgi:hypothetical protein